MVVRILEHSPGSTMETVGRLGDKPALKPETLWVGLQVGNFWRDGFRLFYGSFIGFFEGSFFRGFSSFIRVLFGVSRICSIPVHCPYTCHCPCRGFSLRALG